MAWRAGYAADGRDSMVTSAGPSFVPGDTNGERDAFLWTADARFNYMAGVG
jgi:hypothetical protein